MRIRYWSSDVCSSDRRRLVRINGASASASALGEWLSILWLTPAMDRLFQESPGGRRRFLDRLVLALHPGQPVDSTRDEAAMRSRTKLLTADHPADHLWLPARAAALAEEGEARVVGGRGRVADPGAALAKTNRDTR